MSGYPKIVVTPPGPKARELTKKDERLISPSYVRFYPLVVESGKGCIVRDALLVSLALKSGLRRAELANLAVKDIHTDFLVVRSGKGDKDRAIPLLPDIATRLHNFTRGMKPDDKVFNLQATSIGNKIRRFAQKAGLVDFHTHSMRHKFATDLLNRGANIKHVQELLGHTRLDTTQVYLAVTSQGLRDAVNLLDSNSKQIRFPKPKLGVPVAWTPEDGFEL